jgi:hypothetical protein
MNEKGQRFLHRFQAQMQAFFSLSNCLRRPDDTAVESTGKTKYVLLKKVLNLCETVVICRVCN